jgi:hypothetical protein
MCGSAASHISRQKRRHIHIWAPEQDFFLIVYGFIVASKVLSVLLENRTPPMVLSLPFRAPFALPDEVCRLTDSFLCVSIRVRHSSLQTCSPAPYRHHEWRRQIGMLILRPSLSQQDLSDVKLAQSTMLRAPISMRLNLGAVMK